MSESLLSVTEAAVQAISEATSRDELSRALASGLASLGFQTFNFGCHKKDKDDLVLNPTLCTWSDELMAEYARQGWNRRNPLVHRAVTQEGSFTWSVDDESPESDFRDYSAFLQCAEVESGVIVPVAIGSLLTGLSAETKSARTFTADEIGAVSVLANVATIKAELLNLCPSGIVDECQAARSLSPVQMEILKWAAEGKSNRDIATILSLTKRGVDYHMSEILRKLGVASRTQAIAKWNAG